MEYNSGVDKNDQYTDGVDLSEWNKSNNLKKAKNDGIQFVIIRSSFGYSDYGFQHKGYDLYFEENYKKATQAGLLIGIYHYSYARTIEQAKQEAKRTLKVINGRKLELPIFYDVEDRSLLSNDDGVDNKQFVTDKILAYINIIQQAGYRAGVYANLNWFTNYIDTSRLPKNCDLWIAHYNKNLFESNKALYKGKYSIWQYASNGYKVDGITNFGGGIKNVDVNIAYKDYGNPKQNGWVRNWNDTDDQNTKQEIWHLDNTGWWYENADGSYPKDEWKKINGKWYHFKKDGYMSESQWIGIYYVGKDGAMLVNTTTPDGYKVDENGKWKKETASWKRNNIGWWYENADGSYPQSEWKKINGSWYYFGNNGYMLESQWIGNYYVGSNGAMLVNTTTPDGYEVDENGKWIENQYSNENETNSDSSNNQYHNERFKSLVSQGLTEKEAELAERINEYRRQLGLREFSISKSLTKVARTHVIDSNKYHPEKQYDSRGIKGNLHSWSNHGNWTPVVYTPDHEYARNMWSKPAEISEYKDTGFEIAYINTYNLTAKSALDGWKGSKSHNDVIIGTGFWSDLKVMGVGIDGDYSFVWFGISENDPAGFYWENK